MTDRWERAIQAEQEAVDARASQIDRLAQRYEEDVALWSRMYRTPISARATVKSILKALKTLDGYPFDVPEWYIALDHILDND